MLFRTLFLHVILLCGNIREYFSHSVVTIQHGSFTNVSINGLVYVEVQNIPLGSKFIVYQLHSPFNPLLVSVSPSFTYDASQYSTHSGLASFTENKTTTTFYVYSSYAIPLTAWVKAVAYGPEFPLPGGCGRTAHVGVASAAVTADIITRSINVSGLTSKRIDLLSYWTSSLQFYAASVPSKSKDFVCSDMKDSDKPADSLVYHVYSTPLITAGGSYGAVINPTPDEVAVVIDKMANFGHPSFRGIYIQSLRQSELIPNDEFISNILVSRRPATAYVVTIVLEYSVSGGTWKIPYVPVILFGCRTQNVANFYRVAYGQPIFNASSFIDCGILPKDTPIVLFPIAVLLIASFLYATSCNVWIWPRCAVSMMIMGSAIGLIFFYRFSDNFSDTYVILIVSALLPAFIALFAFVVLWWYCIRPTLYYRRMFGRGPLVKVENPTSVLVNEPWDSDVLDYNRPNVGGPSGFGLPIEYTPIDTVNALPPVQEEVNVTSEFSINNAVLQHFSNNYHSANPIQPTIGDDDNQGDSCFRICGIQLFRRSRDYQKSADSLLRPFKPFKLRPRRFARLPPVLPATFIFVAFLAVSLDRLLKLDKSVVSFFVFSIMLSALPIGLLSFFKNFAFGISTAFVGFYITLCCASFFLIPNSLLPHIVIEYFLMLTWFDVRLHTLRIEFYGQYDILVLVIWFVGSVCFGLLTLCLIRLQDARELTEFQHYNTLNTELPYTSTYVLNRANTVSDSYPSLSGDAKPSSKTLCYVPHIVHVSYLNANVNSATSLDYSHSPTMLHENMHTGSTADDNVVVDYQRRSFNLPTSKVLTENQPLLKSRYYTNYGCLSSSSTGSRRLLPLSRVQLGTASQPLPFGSLSSPSVLPYKMDSMQPNISGDGVNFSFTFSYNEPNT